MFAMSGPSLKETEWPQKKKKFMLTAFASFTPFLCFLCFLHAEPPSPPHRLLEQNDFEEERVLAVPSASSSGVVPSFACPNLHHTTRRSSPPQRSLELCVELGNIPEPPWATILRFVFHDFPFSPIWISNYFNGFFCFLGLWVFLDELWSLWLSPWGRYLLTLFSFQWVIYQSGFVGLNLGSV